MTEVYPTLFSPIKLGPLTLRNRIVMAPLTSQMAEAEALRMMRWPHTTPAVRAVGWA